VVSLEEREHSISAIRGRLKRQLSGLARSLRPGWGYHHVALQRQRRSEPLAVLHGLEIDQLAGAVLADQVAGLAQAHLLIDAEVVAMATSTG